jgi:hypothetical protein
MPNPSGANAVYVPEPGYGEKKQMKNLARSAPMSGGPTAASAYNEPRKAQRRATNPSQPKQAQGQPMPYYDELALTWAEIAQQPGASDLVKLIAQRAAGLYGAR